MITYTKRWLVLLKPLKCINFFTQLYRMTRPPASPAHSAEFHMTRTSVGHEPGCLRQWPLHHA